MKPLVLLIDDDVFPMKLYVRALEREGYEVVQCVDADRGLSFAEERACDIAAIVLDIMMPPGGRYRSSETQEGLTTGVLLYRDLRRLCPRAPIVVLTNVANQSTLSQFPEENRLRVVQKLDYSPFRLAELVGDVIRAAGEGVSIGGGA